MKLAGNIETFVLHFGEMGSRWGFNRTVGQMLALLVVSDRELNADEIAEALSISRGNVSMGLKELQSWRLIRTRRHPGDRKDYFTSAGSIWEMAKTVFEERHKREIDPTLSLLRSAMLDEPENAAEAHAQQRMEEIHDLLELLTQWSGSLATMTPEQLQKLMKLGAGVSRLLELKDKVVGKLSVATPE